MRVLKDTPFRESPEISFLYIAGSSAESKPVDGVGTGSIFKEIDTGNEFQFLEGTPGQWYKQGGAQND